VFGGVAIPVDHPRAGLVRISAREAWLAVPEWRAAPTAALRLSRVPLRLLIGFGPLFYLTPAGGEHQRKYERHDSHVA
jgi:hypothetical protein